MWKKKEFVDIALSVGKDIKTIKTGSDT